MGYNDYQISLFLPADNRTREQLSWLAEQIREASGDAWVWEGSIANGAQGRELSDRMSAEVTAEYVAVSKKAAAALRGSGSLRGRALLRLRRELHKIESRDYVGVPAKQSARDALEKLAAKLEEAKA